MARLQITTFLDASTIPLGDPVSEDVVDIEGTPHNSKPLPGSDTALVVRLFAEVDCFVCWGENPTVKGDGFCGRMLTAGGSEYFQIKAGYKISVIERI